MQRGRKSEKMGRRWLRLMMLGVGMGMLQTAALPLAPQNAPLDCKVGWVGNSFGGKEAWVLQDIDALCVLPDGTLFTNVLWDEAGGNVQQFRDGKLIAFAGHTHGWGYGGGAAVAANDRYLFIAQQVDSEGGSLKGNSWPDKGLLWSGVSRRLRSDIRQGAPFPGGRGQEGDVLKESFLPVAEYAQGQNGTLRGLCADAHRLYVSSPFDNTIKAFDAETMQQIRIWRMDHPDRICLDGKGHLWALRRPEAQAGRWSAVRIGIGTDQDGPPDRKIEFDPAIQPSGICMDPRGQLLISDIGPANQVRIYAEQRGAFLPTGTLGVKNGIFAAPAGQFGALRFNRPTAIGTDASGNLYVASSGSTAGGSVVLESYTPESKLRWRRFGLTFVDMGDATESGDEIYTKEEHFTAGEGAGDRWSYKGYTVNPYRYPNDPRLHAAMATAYVRQIQGHRLLFCTDMTADYLSVYRFAPKTDGETAIPCGLFSHRRHNEMQGYPTGQPDKGEWNWCDRNGDGKIQPEEMMSNGGMDSAGILWPDANGTLWQASPGSIRAIPLRTIRPNGVPQWDYAQAQTWPAPPELDEVRRLRYLPDRDWLILGGNRGPHKNQHWKPMGPVLCLYANATKGDRKLLRTLTLPYEKGANGHESAEPISFDIAGDYLFVAYTRGLQADGIKNAFVKVLRLNDLSLVGNLSAEKALGETGLLDLVESVTARKLPNGEYQILLEDDYRSKIVTFRWRPSP